MRMIWFWLILSLLLLGCGPEKLAGTEVGNPELTITARFKIENTGDTMRVSNMNLTCMGMGYQNMQDSSGMLWGNPTGTTVDMADSNTSQNIRPLKLKTSQWMKADMTLKSMLGDLTLPDTVAFENFVNPKYFKLIKKINGKNFRFLYLLPSNFNIKLMYDKNHIASWLHGDSLTIEILFDAGKWAASLAMNPSEKIRYDAKQQPYQILSPSENATTYQTLNPMLPRCFLADSTELH